MSYPARAEGLGKYAYIWYEYNKVVGTQFLEKKEHELIEQYLNTYDFCN